jgi:NAD(P)-dependent dehydrogenase (short-subunit alcohol dehydrogenase family)
LGNDAGLTLTQTIFEDISDEQFKRVIDVNMWGIYPGIRVFLPRFRTRPEAVIVNMSSLAGLVGIFGYSPYAMSKFAMRGLTASSQ